MKRSDEERLALEALAAHALLEASALAADLPPRRIGLARRIVAFHDLSYIRWKAETQKLTPLQVSEMKAALRREWETG